MIHTRFMHFSCTHLSYSQKDGYLWRKKLNNRTLSVSLRTRLPEIAKFRAQKLTIQYVRIKELSLPFESLRNVLKSYRDRLVDDALLMVLEGGSDMSTMPITTVYEKAVWIGPYISIHFLSLNPLLVRRRRYSRGERYPSALCGCHSL